jgi:hypothetical protein
MLKLFALTGSKDNQPELFRGRALLDVLPFLREHHAGLGSYKLGTMAQHFLGENKEDLDFWMLARLAHSNDPEEQRIAAIYCLKVSCRSFTQAKA